MFTELDKYMKRPLNLSTSELNIVQNLRKDREVLFIETDKSSRIAVLDRNEYKVKMQKAISKMDCSLIEKSPFNKIHKRVKDVIERGI